VGEPQNILPSQVVVEVKQHIARGLRFAAQLINKNIFPCPRGGCEQPTFMIAQSMNNQTFLDQ